MCKDNKSYGGKTSKGLIGLIPAGGQGSRIGPLPCSKEIYPIGFDPHRQDRPKVACHYLLEKMRFAEIKQAYIILKEGKWDIPAYFLDGKMIGMDIAYLVIDDSFGVPYTINKAFPFVREANIAFGFPDIYIETNDVFTMLSARLAYNDCDIVLALFPSDRPDKADMVDLDADGKIRDIIIKQPQTKLSYTWGAAVWTPVFSQFIHSYVEEAVGSLAQKQKELFIGEVVGAAIDSGLRVEAVKVSDEVFLDIGTPEDLLRAARKLMSGQDKGHP